MPLVGLAALLVAAAQAPSDEAVKEKTKVDAKAVARARKTVLMLDDIYKTTIVLITDKYVTKKDDVPAGRAFAALFRQMSKKGYHEVRLIDVSGEPYNPRNIAEDAFDKKGVEQLKAGKASYEQVVTEKGKPYLRAITAIPVVMDKCVLCHPNYKDAKKGAAVGALTYKVPIE